MRSLIAAAVLLGGCRNDDAAPADARTFPDRHGETASLLLNRITHWGEDGAYVVGRFEARFRDVSEPPFHVLGDTVGDCRLWRFTPAFCEEPCAGACIAPGECHPYPTYLSAGDLHIRGTETPLDISNRDGIYYPDALLPEEYWGPGDELDVSWAGADYPGDSLRVVAPPRLDALSGIDVVELSDDSDATFTWTAADGADAEVTLRITSANGSHGSPVYAYLECRVAFADGSLSVPKELIGQLPTIDSSLPCVGIDCPFSVIRAESSAMTATAAGDASLVVADEVHFAVRHPTPGRVR